MSKHQEQMRVRNKNNLIRKLCHYHPSTDKKTKIRYWTKRKDCFVEGDKDIYKYPFLNFFPLDDLTSALLILDDSDVFTHYAIDKTNDSLYEISACYKVHNYETTKQATGVGNSLLSALRSLFYDAIGCIDLAEKEARRESEARELKHRLEYNKKHGVVFDGDVYT
jgi:hypothetical protein